MLIDAHHHLWHYNAPEYGWIGPSMEVLKRDYLPAHLAYEMEKAGVSGTIVVQARQSIRETQWLLEEAGRTPFIRGVVGWFDLLSEHLADQLEQFATHPRLVGARHLLHDEPDDDFMLRPAFLKGMEKLQEYKLVYDLLLFPKHLGRAYILAEQFPEQRFVLDHLAKPFIRSGVMQPWKNDMEALATLPNVWCKISGMVTEADTARWRYEEFVPYLETVLAAFGTRRIMLGSDWPVCLLGAEYGQVMELPLRFIGGMEEVEKERICSLNAINCYQLE